MMLRRKDISHNAIVAAHQSGKGYIRPFPNNLKLNCSTVRDIIHKWKTFETAANLPKGGDSSKFTPRSTVQCSHHL